LKSNITIDLSEAESEELGLI